MEKYCFPDAERSRLEASCVPLGVYQFLGGRVVTLILSDGFCELFGYDAGEVLSTPFTVVTPDSSNPYRQMYVAN